MERVLKYFNKYFKHPLIIGSVIAFFLVAAIAIPITSDSVSAASWYKKIPTSISIKIEKNEYPIGVNVHGDGLLAGTTGLSYVKIYLKVTLPDGTVTYPTQGSKTYTTWGGSFGIDYVPTQTGLHKFTVTYQGSYRYSSSTNTVNFNVVDPITPNAPVKSATSISLIPASTSIETGKSMHADGTLSAGTGIPSTLLSVMVTLPDGTNVNPDQGSQVLTDSSGNFDMDYTPTIIGVHRYIATFAGNDKYNSSTTSVSFSVVAPAPIYKSASSITLTLASSSIETGNNMHAEGLLKGITSIAGASVSLMVTLPDGGTTYPAQGATTVTDSSGKFTIDYVPTKAGMYKFTVNFSGNSQYNGSSVSSSFTTNDPAPAPTSAKYIITKESGIYYARSASGKTLTSNSDLAEVVQTALRYLTANRVNEEKVSIQCDGILTKAIVMPSYSILELGAGNTLQCSSGHSAVIGVDVNHVEVLGGHWDGTQTQCQGLIDFTRCDDVYIHDLEAFGTLTLSPNYDIRLEDCTNSLIANNELHGSKWNSNSHAGIELVNDCSDIRITRNVIYDHGWNGIILVVNNYPGTHTLWRTIIDNNTITNVAHDGISLYPIMHAAPASYIRDTIIEYNTLTDTAATSNGCYIWVQGIIENQGDVINTIVRYNTLRNTGLYAPSAMIQVAGTGSQIYNNDIYDAGGKAAIALILSYNANVHDNNIIGTRGSTDGILLMGSCNNVISNNQIKNCYLGIEMRCWVSSDSNYPSDDSSGNVFSGNTIITPRSAGVYIASASGSYIQTGNKITNNHFVGLPSSYPTGIVDYGSSTVISGNTIS